MIQARGWLPWLTLVFASTATIVGRPGPPAQVADAVVFTDITRDTGITFSHMSSPDKKYILESMSGGVAMFDYNKDGLLDLYFVNSPTVERAADPRAARSELWQNRGSGTFVNVTEAAGVGDPGWGMGAVAADVDNDGWEDLYVTCYGPNRLYRNNRNGTFSDATDKAGVGDPRWSTGAAFADYDGDGWLDLFVANYVDVRLDALPAFGKGKFCEFRGIAVQCGPRGLPGAGDSLYRNRRNGTFENVSARAGVADAAGRFGMGAVWSDFNDDGRPDLFVANDAGPNFLHRNNGDGTFADMAFGAGVALDESGKEQGSMGVAVGDYNHSGAWSIFVSNFSDEYNALYRHDRGFQFTDVSLASQTAKASVPYVGWGTHFFDYDNDGWLDLVVVNGHVYPQVERAGAGARYAQPALLYHNNRNGTFAEVTAAAGSALAKPSVSRGSVAGDLDNDGDLDLVINNLDGAPTVLRNDGGNRQNFLVVDLEGRTTNRDGVGVIVTVRAGDLVQRAERRSGDSYLSRSDPRLHVGLAHHARVDSLEVRWSKANVQRFDGITANTFIKIIEGASAPMRAPLVGKAGQ
jgi:hypothetical protein